MPTKAAKSDIFFKNPLQAKERHLICAGLYSDKGDKHVKGAFFVKIDPESGASLIESYKVFGLVTCLKTLRGDIRCLDMYEDYFQLIWQLI